MTAFRFNRPPGWPPAPGDWVPPQNWVPPDDWCRAPHNWQYWSRSDEVEPKDVARLPLRWRAVQRGAWLVAWSASAVSLVFVTALIVAGIRLVAGGGTLTSLVMHPEFFTLLAAAALVAANAWLWQWAVPVLSRFRAWKERALVFALVVLPTANALELPRLLPDDGVPLFDRVAGALIFVLTRN